MGMKTMILCGGQGTRIRDVADRIPKPMIPVGKFPILWHIMKYYAHAGHHDFVLCLGHQGQAIKDFFLNYEAYTNDFTVTLGQDAGVEFHNRHPEDGWKITLAETGLDSMTGARIRKAKKYVEQDDHFFLTYGDGLSNVDIQALFDFHRSHGKILTVTAVRPMGRFGEIVSDPVGNVLAFNEKPETTPGRISAGFFVCRREIFDYLGDGDELVFEKEPMQRLAKDKQLVAYAHDGFWHPMDTHRDYTYLNSLESSGSAPWRVW